MSTSTTTKTSFFARVMAELRKLFQHAPGWEAGAAATMTYIAPLVEGLVALTEPAAAPAVNALIAKIQSATAAAAVLIKAAGPKPTLLVYLNAVVKNLGLIESMAGIKDPESEAKLKALLDLIAGEVNEVIAALQGA